MNATITVPNTAGAGASNIKNMIMKNCTPLTNCISKISNTQIDNAKDVDIVMLMYNLIEYSDNYSKISGGLWHYYRGESILANGAIADFPTDNSNSAPFKFTTKKSGRTEDDGTKC